MRAKDLSREGTKGIWALKRGFYFCKKPGHEAIRSPENSTAIDGVQIVEKWATNQILDGLSQAVLFSRKTLQTESCIEPHSSISVTKTIFPMMSHLQVRMNTIKVDAMLSWTIRKRKKCFGGQKKR